MGNVAKTVAAKCGMNFLPPRFRNQIGRFLVLFLLACASFTPSALSQKPFNFQEIAKQLASGSDNASKMAVPILLLLLIPFVR